MSFSRETLYINETISINRDFPSGIVWGYAVDLDGSIAASNSVPNTLPNMWKSYSWVDRAVYSLEPTESEFKSRLSLFCRHYPSNPGSWSYYLGALEVGGHTIDQAEMYNTGSPHYFEPDSIWVVTNGGSYIWPNEIQNLWTAGTDRKGVYHIRPDHTIVSAQLCYSVVDVHDYATPPWFSEMAHSFVAYGAAAYAGSRSTIPFTMDPYTYEFWWSLTYQDQTIADAGIEGYQAFVAVYGLGHICEPYPVIVGSDSATMPN